MHVKCLVHGADGSSLGTKRWSLPFSACWSLVGIADEQIQPRVICPAQNCITLSASACKGWHRWARGLLEGDRSKDISLGVGYLFILPICKRPWETNRVPDIAFQEVA